MKSSILALLFNMNFAKNVYPRLGMENDINPVSDGDSGLIDSEIRSSDSTNSFTEKSMLTTFKNQSEADTDFGIFDLNQSKVEQTPDQVMETKITKTVLLGDIHANVREIRWMKRNRRKEKDQMDRKMESVRKIFKCLLRKMGKRDRDFFVLSVMQTMCIIALFTFQIVAISTR